VAACREPLGFGGNRGGGDRVSEYLLGIDEGTSAVKAVVYDTELRTIAEARAEKRLHHPRPGWVEQDGEEVLAAVTRAVEEVLQLARESDSSLEVAACGLDHQGESVLAWDAETREALTPIVTWQDKRSQEILDRLENEGRAGHVRERSGMPLDPYFSAGKITWLLEHDDAVAAARDRGTLRIGTVDSWICDRLGAGFATDPSTASRTQLGAPDWDDELLGVFGVPREALTTGRSSCRFAPGAWTSRRRSQAPAASFPAA
jgi:glycerol kinase